ncbi:Sir2 family NAD-dependent protein deacetylase [Pedobacter roseus]|uniref:Sir2 family NAD-dependent protein deacetylase n=1 Tax=Pedobacter roseus TaxID=336820 RepID=UPI00293C0C91|nr:Sir2 family NAD-dependent protein deacetylase [Pedobacter roseus]
MKLKLVVLTGAGISAESGLKTFRDADGLWEGYNVYDVATPKPGKKIRNWFKNFIMSEENRF